MTTTRSDEVMFRIDLLYAPLEGGRCAPKRAVHLVRAPKDQGKQARDKSKAWLKANDPGIDLSILWCPFEINGLPGVQLGDDQFEPLKEV